jgi:hypothetical protein
MWRAVGGAPLARPVGRVRLVQDEVRLPWDLRPALAWLTSFQRRSIRRRLAGRRPRVPLGSVLGRLLGVLKARVHEEAPQRVLNWMRLVNVQPLPVDCDFVHDSQAVGTGIEVSPARKEGCNTGSPVLREGPFHQPS